MCANIAAMSVGSSRCYLEVAKRAQTNEHADAERRLRFFLREPIAENYIRCGVTAIYIIIHVTLCKSHYSFVIDWKGHM